MPFIIIKYTIKGQQNLDCAIIIAINIIYKIIYEVSGGLMRKIEEVIVVEGKTDTAILKRLLDVDTIETNGLAMTQETLELIVKTNEKRGVIVLTDPDYPGLKIRERIQQATNCKHAFVAKDDAIKNYRGKTKVGIAQSRQEAILDALENLVSFQENQESISWREFLSLDIVGDKQRRLKVYQHFNLGYGNVKTLFKRLNMLGITLQMVKEILD